VWKIICTFSVQGHNYLQKTSLPGEKIRLLAGHVLHELFYFLMADELSPDFSSSQ
jgi:hypothetical protein